MAFNTKLSAVHPWLRGFYDTSGSFIAGIHATLLSGSNILFAGQIGFGSGTAPTNAPTGVSATTQVAHQPLGSFTLPTLAAGASTTITVSNNLVRDLSHIVCYPLSDPGGATVVLTVVVTARTMSSAAGQFTVTICNAGSGASAAHTDIGYHIFN